VINKSEQFIADAEERFDERLKQFEEKNEYSIMEDRVPAE